MGKKPIFMSRDAFAAFLFNSCPFPDKQVFVADDMIQVDGLDKNGKVTRRMLAFPNGEVINFPDGLPEAPK